MANSADRNRLRLQPKRPDPVEAAPVRSCRRGAALLLTLFMMSITSLIVVTMLRAEMTQYAALRNTIEYDRASYLAEAGLNHALSRLETDITRRGTLPETELPAGSGHRYRATAADGTGGTVVVTGTGKVGSFERTLRIRIKQGG